MKKKTVAVLISAVMVLSLFSGCGRKPWGRNGDDRSSPGEWLGCF